MISSQGSAEEEAMSWQVLRSGALVSDQTCFAPFWSEADRFPSRATIRLRPSRNSWSMSDPSTWMSHRTFLRTRTASRSFWPPTASTRMVRSFPMVLTNRSLLRVSFIPVSLLRGSFVNTLWYPAKEVPKRRLCRDRCFVVERWSPTRLVLPRFGLKRIVSLPEPRSAWDLLGTVGLCQIRAHGCRIAPSWGLGRRPGASDRRPHPRGWCAASPWYSPIDHSLGSVSSLSASTSSGEVPATAAFPCSAG